MEHSRIMTASHVCKSAPTVNLGISTLTSVWPIAVQATKTTRPTCVCLTVHQTPTCSHKTQPCSACLSVRPVFMPIKWIVPVWLNVLIPILLTLPLVHVCFSARPTSIPLRIASSANACPAVPIIVSMAAMSSFTLTLQPRDVWVCALPSLRDYMATILLTIAWINAPLGHLAIMTRDYAWMPVFLRIPSLHGRITLTIFVWPYARSATLLIIGLFRVRQPARWASMLITIQGDV